MVLVLVLGVAVVRVYRVNRRKFAWFTAVFFTVLSTASIISEIISDVSGS